jgi:hypothetical protein
MGGHMIQFTYRAVGSRDLLIVSLSPEDLRRVIHGESVVTSVDLPGFASLDVGLRLVSGGDAPGTFESGQDGFLVSTQPVHRHPDRHPENGTKKWGPPPC